LAGVSDNNLMASLRPIVRTALNSSELLSVNYGDARQILEITDRDPNNPSNVILIYRQTSVKGLWDGGITWNREHVWPQSLMGVSTENSSRHKGADLHNLKPANPSENSSRGNKYFSEATTTTSYAPPAVVRGDIARIMFYMITMYPDLSLVDITSGSPATYQMAQFSLFIKWHLEDPVDAFEQNRNGVIYQYQGNRNPFIDHQELVCRMFRSQTPAATTACDQA
jgi:endonuclease I